MHMKVCLRLSLVSFHRSEEEDAEIGRSCGRTLGHGMMVRSWAGVSEEDLECVYEGTADGKTGGVYFQAHSKGTSLVGCFVDVGPWYVP